MSNEHTKPLYHWSVIQWPCVLLFLYDNATFSHNCGKYDDDIVKTISKYGAHKATHPHCTSVPPVVEVQHLVGRVIFHCLSPQKMTGQPLAPGNEIRKHQWFISIRRHKFLVICIQVIVWCNVEHIYWVTVIMKKLSVPSIYDWNTFLFTAIIEKNQVEFAYPFFMIIQLYFKTH